MESPLREALAEYTHLTWSRWMRYMLGECTGGPPNLTTIPKPLVERWKHQMGMEYKDLSEAEKESDRAEADEMLKIVAEKLNQSYTSPDVQR